MKETLIEIIITKYYNSKVFVNNTPNLSGWIGGTFFLSFFLSFIPTPFQAALAYVGI